MKTFREFLVETTGLRAGTFDHFKHHVRAAAEHEGTDVGEYHQTVLARHYGVKDNSADFDDAGSLSDEQLKTVYHKAIKPIGATATKNYQVK
jgi:hypothetical protein